jgi:hypothetical protein
MNMRFEYYRFAGQRFVNGWLESGALTMVKVLDSAQRAKNVSGAVAEIGVHHGRLFIALNLLQHRDERSLAIDVFGAQELNVDQSGSGDLEKFRQNVERWSSADKMVIHQGDSTKLDSAQVRRLVDAGVRLFSVDGGHTASTVLSDMNLAEGALCPGGIVIADDVFNQWWPGVAIGTFRYMEQGTLRPFAIGFNKVLFSSPEYADYYREELARYLENRYPLVSKETDLGGFDVLAVGRVTPMPRQMISRSRATKKLYHRFQSVR